jgi:ABC-type multidrug transport system fused ATPase/permease subunit
VTFTPHYCGTRIAIWCSESRPAAGIECDLIFELDNGKIVGRGTYSELLKDSETFRRLISLDAIESGPSYARRP